MWVWGEGGGRLSGMGEGTKEVKKGKGKEIRATTIPPPHTFCPPPFPSPLIPPSPSHTNPPKSQIPKTFSRLELKDVCCFVILRYIFLFLFIEFEEERRKIEEKRNRKIGKAPFVISFPPGHRNGPPAFVVTVLIVLIILFYILF